MAINTDDLSSTPILFDDHLPNRICKDCTYQLDAAYKFKRKCEDTNVLLRKHLQIQSTSSSSLSAPSQSIPVPEEIQIDSDDDDDDVAGIPEPLVVLSSNTNLEDHDPLDLGHEENQSLYDADSRIGHTNNMNEEIAMDCSSDKSTDQDNRNWKSTAFNSNPQPIDVICMKKDECALESNGRFTDSEDQEDQRIVECRSEEPSDFHSTQNAQISQSSEEHISIPEHFLNESFDDSQYKNSYKDMDRNKCPVCGESFVSRFRMELHLSVHDGELPYSCHVCKKSFSREGGLKAHMKLHSGERPHVCTVCNKAFSLKGNLKVHQRLHTGEKPFKCTTCMKAFTQKISLTKHLSVHKALV